MNVEEADKLSEGLYDAISSLLWSQAAYTDLDFEDEDTIRIISNVLHKIANDLVSDFEYESINGEEK